MVTADQIRDVFEGLGDGHLDRLIDLLADDVVLEFPGRRFGGRFDGKRRVGVFLKRNQRMFRDGLAFTVHWAGVVGERAIVQWTNAGVTKDGVDYGNRGVTILRLERDEIVEIQDYLDTELLSETWP